MGLLSTRGSHQAGLQPKLRGTRDGALQARLSLCEPLRPHLLREDGWPSEPVGGAIEAGTPSHLCSRLGQ